MIDNENILNKKEIGNRIKRIRQNSFENKMTLDEFGELFNPVATKGTVNKWEKGRNLPSKERLKKIAEIGNVSLPYLYFGITEENEVEKIVEVEKIITPKNSLKEETVLDNVAIGKRIKEVRLNISEKKTTLETFGKMLDLQTDKGVVGRWEKGVNLPNKERLKQIAQIGNVPVEYLYFGINTVKVTEILEEIENNPVSDVGFFITREQINDLKKSMNLN